MTMTIMMILRPVFLSSFFLALALQSHITDARLTGAVDDVVAKLSSDSSMCQVVQDDLPPECTCTDNAAGPLSFVVECTKVFDDDMLNDTVGMKLGVAPCDPEGATISLNITEENHGIDLKVAGIRAGEETNLPIPGLSAIVPPIGHIGVDAAILVSGTVDSLTLQVGLNACAVIHTHEICASSIPGLNRILPWWILKGTYSFGDVCKKRQAIIAASTNMVQAANNKRHDDKDEDPTDWSRIVTWRK